MSKNNIKPAFPSSLPKLTMVGMGLLCTQIIFGAFVAGKDAGMIHNYWPNMNPSEFIATRIFTEGGILNNFNSFTVTLPTLL